MTSPFHKMTRCFWFGFRVGIIISIFFLHFYNIKPLNDIYLFFTNVNLIPSLNHSQITQIVKETFPFLKDEDIEEFISMCEVIKSPNKKVLVKGGEVSYNVYFILDGLIRGYFTNEKGLEKNIFLRSERTISGAPNSIFRNQPARYTFEAVGECQLLKFKVSDMLKLTKQNSNIARIYITGLQETIDSLIFRVESLIDKMPEKRYEQLIATNPQFFQKAYNKHIANYLGITSVSLSRIIKRKLENRN